ncbi:MAG TPA: type IV pilus assembly protein PilM [Acidimicrobiales bacterium]|nr:type IV pilus assembly protein PilM [Acidimicrobiales bacterium]
MPKKGSIGLDIGSSAVRAAEVVIDGDKKVLRRFAQVGLPAGAVVEGEVHDAAAVTAAIRKLWEHGGFSDNRVVMGLGSQRAMVRQVEMPALSDAELRSALRFKIGEFLPIPVEQAIVDFAPVPGLGGSGDSRRVLLVAAQREVVVDEVVAVEAAGLRVRAVDCSSLALLRAVRPSDEGGGGGLEAVVGIGAELITVVVKEAGAPRFVRTVAHATPTGQLGDGSAPRPGTPRRQVNLGPGPAGSALGVAIAPRIDAIVNEVRSSFEYLLSQSGSAKFDRVLVTGGGAMTAGVLDELSAAVGLPVHLAEPAVQVEEKALALEPELFKEATYRWLTAVGLALWGTDTYGKPTLLPPEVTAKHDRRRAIVTAAGGMCAVMLALGVVSVGKVHSASDISSKIRTTNLQSAQLEQEIAKLGYVMQVPNEVQARRALAIEALSGDIDWIGLLQNIERVVPSNVSLESLTLTKTEAAAGAPTPAPQSSVAIVGTVSIAAQTSGGARAVSQFIERFSHDKDLFAVWVSSTTTLEGSTQIQATGELTGAVLNNRRTTDLPGGSE